MKVCVVWFHSFQFRACVDISICGKITRASTSDSILIMIIIVVLLTIQYIFQYLTHEEYIYEYVMILLTYGLFIQNIFSSQRFGKQFLKCRFRLVLQHIAMPIWAVSLPPARHRTGFVSSLARRLSECTKY